MLLHAAHAARRAGSLVATGIVYALAASQRLHHVVRQLLTASLDEDVAAGLDLRRPLQISLAHPRGDEQLQRPLPDRRRCAGSRRRPWPARNAHGWA